MLYLKTPGETVGLQVVQLTQIHSDTPLQLAMGGLLDKPLKEKGLETGGGLRDAAG